MSLEEKETKIDTYVDLQIANKASGNWEWRRIKYKEAQKEMIENPVVTIDEIDTDRDLTDFLDNQRNRVPIQTYYLLIKIKELEDRVKALEPVSVEPK